MLGIVRLTLHAGQCRDAPSTIPLLSASLSARHYQPRRVVVPQIQPEFQGCRGSAGRTGHHRVVRNYSAVVREVRARLRPPVEAPTRSTRRPCRSLAPTHATTGASDARLHLTQPRAAVLTRRRGHSESISGGSASAEVGSSSDAAGPVVHRVG